MFFKIVFFCAAYAEKNAVLPLCVQGVLVEDVLRVLRERFGTSGIDEKAARPSK